MKNQQANSRLNMRQRGGFAMFVLALLLVIVGLFIEVSVKTKPEITLTKVTDTRTKIAKIKVALEVYKTTNGSYPCPASRVDLEAASTFGASTTCTSTPGTCTAQTGIVCATDAANVAIGVVPTRTLSLADDVGFDEWGNRINYAADMSGGKGITAQNIAAVATTNKYFIYSSGTNGRGAYNRQGKQKVACGAVSNPPYDPENCDDDAVFVADNWRLATDTKSYDYDDLTASPVAEVTCPGLIAGCTLWLAAWDVDGDGTCYSGSGITGCADDTDEPTNGTSVSTWVDKSGAGRNATPANASYKPVYTTNQINGMPVVAKTADTQKLVTASANWGGTGAELTDFTTIMVVKPTAYTANRVYYYANPMQFINYLGGYWPVTYSNVYTPIFFAPLNITDIVTFRNTGSTRLYELDVNGQNVLHATATTPFASTTSVFTIGGDNAGNTYGQSQYGEIIHYNRRLSNSELETIYSDLYARWGVPTPAQYTCPSLGASCPGGVAGCTEWLDATDPTRILNTSGTSAIDTQAVGMWCDRSGNGRNAMPRKVTNSPTFVQDGTGTGFPAVNTRYGFMALPWHDTVKPFTYTIVFKNASPKPAANVSYIVDQSAGYGGYGPSVSGTIGFNYYGSNGYLYATRAGLLGGFNDDYQSTVLSLRVNSNNTSELFRNGIKVSQTADPYGTYPYLSILLGPGANTNISQFAYYPIALSDPNLALVENDLATKAGITLPSNMTCPVTSSCPAGISDCVFWLDSSDSSTMLKSNNAAVSSYGDDVFTWCDKSSNHLRSLLNGTATYAALGSYPSVSMASGQMQMLYSPLATTRSIFIAGKKTSTNARYFRTYLGYEQGAFGYGGPGGASNYMYFLPAGQTRTWGVNNTNTSVFGLVISSPSPYSYVNFQNGYEYTPFTTTTALADPQSHTFSSMQFNEIAVFNRALDATETKVMNCYLMDKWGLCDATTPAVPANYCDGVAGDIYCLNGGLGTSANTVP